MFIFPLNFSARLIFIFVATEGKFTEQMARRYFQELVDGVDFCHGHGVYHRDLKPENLLLDSEGRLKISDFGLSAHIASTSPDGALSPTQRRRAEATLLKTRCGTPQYAAPEVVAR